MRRRPEIQTRFDFSGDPQDASIREDFIARVFAYDRFRASG
jgi:hypothetical protein